MARRGQHEGNLTKLPSGHYRARLRLAGEPYSATFASRREAILWLAELRQRHSERRLPPRAAQTRTVSALLDSYLAGLALRGLTPKQVRDRAGNAELYVRPHLGHLRVVDVTEAHIRALLAHVATSGADGRGRSAQTVRRTHTTIRQALALGVSDGIALRNVAEAVRPPPLPKRPPRAMQADELARFWRVASSHRLYALWLLAARTGLRQGEQRALRWQDLDLAGATITIAQNLPASARPGEEKAAKTLAGLRTFDVTPGLVAALREHRQRQVEERLALGSRWQDSGLVFTTRRGTCLSAVWIYRQFKTLLARAGLPASYRPHDLRHTAASHLIAAGIPLPEVAAILGHASPSITAAVYAHWVRRGGRSALQRVEDWQTEGERDTRDTGA